MDGNKNEINNVETITCTHCGNLNNKENKFCIYCGTAINGNDSINQEPTTNQQVNNVQPPQKEKNPYIAIMIILGIVSIALSLYNQEFAIFLFITTIASLFSKKTRPYGLTILITIGISIGVEIILIIILFGMCFVGLR